MVSLERMAQNEIHQGLYLAETWCRQAPHTMRTFSHKRGCAVGAMIPCLMCEPTQGHSETDMSSVFDVSQNSSGTTISLQFPFSDFFCWNCISLFFVTCTFRKVFAVSHVWGVRQHIPPMRFFVLFFWVIRIIYIIKRFTPK